MKMAFLSNMTNNVHVDRACVSHSLKLLSTLASGLYAGSAVYISLVESPARMTHDAETAVTMWKPSFIRAKSAMTKLIIVAGGSSGGAFWMSDRQSFDTWLLAGGIMFCLMPIPFYTFSVNKTLMDTEKCIEKGNDWTVSTLNTWDRYHAVKTVISMGVFGYMLWLLTENK